MIATPSGEACLACGSRQFRTLFHSADRLYRTTTRRFAVVECSGCGLIRLYPWPGPEELRNYYPDGYWFRAEEGTASRLEELYRRVVLRDHVAFVRQALRGIPSGILLDVGCGGGLFPRMMREEGFSAVGLDVSLAAAGVAWNRNGVPAVCGNLSAAPFQPGTCACITMFHIVEHLYDPASYLQAAHTLLHPDGRLIVQVPNAACWQFLLLGERWNGIDVPRHLVDYRSRDLDSLLESCGFVTLRYKYFSLRDNPAGLASSLAAGLDPMARRIRTGPRESEGRRLLKDSIYFALVLAAMPFTLLEAACRSGSTVMIEARKRG